MAGDPWVYNNMSYDRQWNTFESFEIENLKSSVLQLKQELFEQKETNKELMRILAIIHEDEEVLKEFKALKDAYEKYLFLRKLTIGKTGFD